MRLHQAQFNYQQDHLICLGDVCDGWPEVMVWQGGPTVITAVGDAEPGELQTILSALPRQPNRGTLGSLQQRMGSALAWFKS